MVKNLPAMQETWVLSLAGKIPRRREWLPTSVFLPRESHGQRSLAGYSPWGGKESDTAERLYFLPSMLYGFPGGSSGKEPTCQCRRHKRHGFHSSVGCLQCGRPGFDPWLGKILWRRKWHPTPVFLPGESHGQRSLAGYIQPSHPLSSPSPPALNLSQHQGLF